MKLRINLVTNILKMPHQEFMYCQISEQKIQQTEPKHSISTSRQNVFEKLRVLYNFIHDSHSLSGDQTECSTWKNIHIKQ